MDEQEEDARTWFKREVIAAEPLLRAYGMRFCQRSPDQLDDLVHDVFAQLISYPGWREIKNVPGFAVRTLRNIALQSMRRSKIVPINILSDLQATMVADEAPTAERVVEGQDELRRLAEIIRGLPPQCRKVFVLRKVHGLSTETIAMRLGLSVSTVEKHLTKGLRLCCEQLATEPKVTLRTAMQKIGARRWRGIR